MVFFSFPEVVGATERRGGGGAERRKSGRALGNRCSESKQFIRLCIIRKGEWGVQEGAEVGTGDLFKGGSTLFVELNVNCVDAFVDCLSHCLIVCLFVLSGFHARYRCDKPPLRMVGERREAKGTNN